MFVHDSIYWRNELIADLRLSGIFIGIIWLYSNTLHECQDTIYRPTPLNKPKIRFYRYRTFLIITGFRPGTIGRSLPDWSRRHVWLDDGDLWTRLAASWWCWWWFGFLLHRYLWPWLLMLILRDGRLILWSLI